MIIEYPLVQLLELETLTGDVWSPWTGQLRSLSITRGGNRRGPTTTVDVGSLVATLVNAGDPLAGGTLAPNKPIRLRDSSTDLTIWRGRIDDIFTDYKLDKSTGTTTEILTISAVDAVASHGSITIYGAFTTGATFESWASRIIRLSASATETVIAPADDAPIVRYAI